MEDTVLKVRLARDHLVMYTDIESLLCTSETIINIMLYVSYISIKKKEL